MSNVGGENEDVAAYHPTYNLDSNDTSFEPDFQAPTAQTQQQQQQDVAASDNKGSNNSVPSSPGENGEEGRAKMKDDDDDDENGEGAATVVKNPSLLHAPDAWLFDELNQPDEIMETDVLSTLGRFLQAGGSPEQVITSLASSYKGYAQMINITQYWLLASGMSKEEVNSIITANLKEMILEQFDPKKADTIFQNSTTSPVWLEYMIRSEEWRSVLYKLTDKYKDCLLLRFAIQRIASEGFTAEIANLSSSSLHLSIFSRVLELSLRETIDSVLDDTCDHTCRTLFDTQIFFDSIRSSLSDSGSSKVNFFKVCSRDLQTYFFTQALLMTLSQREQDEGRLMTLRRLAQDLEQTVAQVAGHRILQKMFSVLMGAKYETWKTYDIMDRVSYILEKRASIPGHIIQIYRLYQVQTNPPPVLFIRNPFFLEILLDEVFGIHEAPQSQCLSEKCYIISFAVSVEDQRGVSSALPAPVNKDKVQETKNAILSIATLCNKSFFDPEDWIKNLQSIQNHLEYPVVSVGMIKWIAKKFLENEFYISTHFSVSYRIFHFLLREITKRNKPLCPIILQLLIKAFNPPGELSTNEKERIRSTIVEDLLYMIKYGFVMPVLKEVSSMSLGSLLRFFVKKLLSVIEGPFSEAFVGSLIQIISSPSNREILLSHGDTRSAVLKFIQSLDRASIPLSVQPVVDDLTKEFSAPLASSLSLSSSLSSSLVSV